MGTDDDGEAPPGLSSAPKRHKTITVRQTSEADDHGSRDGADSSSSALDERHHESPEGEVAGRERRDPADPRRWTEEAQRQPSAQQLS